VRTKTASGEFLDTRAICGLLLGSLAIAVAATQDAEASPPWWKWGHGRAGGAPHCACTPGEGDVGGTWHWVRSPDEEKRVVIGLFNRYCVRCHAVDGRGVWDMPGVPDFTNTRWQASRSDADLARIILEGRGAVMPPFRGTVTLEESWAMARYLRTFVPEAEAARPDLSQPEKPAADARPAAPKKLDEPPR
jgi:Cytochrome C oxidase, cbb3-type, subunit III